MNDELDGIIAKVLKLDRHALRDDLTIDDVETWDSLRHMELVTAIEGAMAIEFTLEEISAMLSVGAIRATTAAKRRG